MRKLLATFHGVSPRGEVRTVSIRFDADYGEYVCEVVDGGARRKNVDYFTCDKDDALATAQAMVAPR